MSDDHAWVLDETDLVSSHGKRVDVTLFGGVAVQEFKLRWVEQLRGHVTNNTGLRGCGATWLHDGGIGDDTRDSEIAQTRDTGFADQDVSLDRISMGASASG